jgi:hypothetical protein
VTQSDSLAVMNSLQMVLKGAQRGHTTSPPTLPPRLYRCRTLTVPIRSFVVHVRLSRYRR